ncbi:MAG: phytoene/squalene synthase family protein [Xanthobacteraceae bacterium]
MQDAFGHCEALVRGADKDRFLATLFAPARYRRALFALYAFNAEIAQVRELAREPMPGELRLQWWRDVFGGASGSEASAHPVAAALLATVVRYRLPQALFLDLLEARAFDLYDDPMGSMAELDGYAAKTSSAIMQLAALILNDGRNPDVDALTRRAGIGYAIAGLLSALPWYAARRQLYVPLDLLHRHGARAEDVFAAKTTPELQAAFAGLRSHARDELAAAHPLIRALPAGLLPALLPAALVRPMLDRMERRDPFVPSPLPQWRRQWLLWRAARKPMRIFR